MLKIFQRLKENSRGHSLVEVMVAVGILAFVAIAIFLFSMHTQQEIGQLTARENSL